MTEKFRWSLKINLRGVERENMIEVFRRRLLTPKEVAESGLISLVKQWDLRRRGLLEFIRVGRRIFYSEEALNRFFEKSTVGQSSTASNELDANN